MADNSSSPSPDQSPSSSSPPPPSPNSSSSSPPPSSPPPSPPTPSESSPSPPPPPSSDSSSSPSPPPPSSEGSSPSLSPPPPSEGGINTGNNNNNNRQPPPSGNGDEPPKEEVPSQTRSPPRELAPPAPPGSSTRQSPSPSITDGSSSGGSSVQSRSNDNSGVVTGLVVVGSVLLFLMAICVVCLRKKKKKGVDMSSYGWDGPSKPQGSNQHWQQSSQDYHAVNIPPTPDNGWGGHATGSSGHDHSVKKSEQSIQQSNSNLTLGFNKSTFTYAELAAATNGFDRSRMLGQGGFGYVHKGELPNGKEIAVKSLKTGSGQGEREFQSEVEIISRVHHRHLVSLVGYCIAGGQRMLVYEYVPNGNLEYHLHKKGELDFPTRLRIALGSAKGLGYLHEDCHPRIIHRDIKASNILLDENYEAMVADFGLAKLTTDTNTHVSTRVMGTFGYLAPEYASSGKLTEKSDVFSYGVMLLEIITGRRPVDSNMKYMEDSLVDWSRPLLAKALETSNNYHEFVDPRLEGNYDPNLMKRMVACAAASIRHSAKRRPKMSQIVRALEGDVSLEDLNTEGVKATGQNSMFSSSEGSDYDTRAYSKDLKKFRQMAFATQDFASSEYGATTSEYGLNPSSSSSDISKEINNKNIP